MSAGSKPSPFSPGAWNWAALGSILCGLLAAGLGVTVLVGWHLGSVALTRIQPDFAAMQYLTALGFLLSGLGLVTAAARVSCVYSRVCGGVVAAIGLALCLEYLFGVSLGFDLSLAHLPGPHLEISRRPSPPTSVCFLLCGTAIALLAPGGVGSSRRLVIGLFGSLALALSLMALCGYATGLAGTYVWGPFIGMAVHTAAGFAVLSGGLLVTQWRDGASLAADRWLPIPLAVATITAALVLWQALLADGERENRAKSLLVAQRLKGTLATEIGAPIRALERMKRRWDLRGGTPFEEWAADASAYVSDEKTLVTILWVDATRRGRWAVPEGSPAIAEAGLAGGTGWMGAEILDRARREGAMVVSPFVTLPNGVRGFYLCYPLFPGGRFDGFLVGAVSLKELMALALGDIRRPEAAISVFEGDDLLYGNGGRTTSKSFAQVEFDFYGRPWRIVVAPQPGGPFSIENALPNVVLLLGVLLGTTLALTVRALQLKTRHARDGRSANEKLKAEITERWSIEKKLRESEERLRIVLDAATGVSVISTDPVGTITYFSKGSEKMLGYLAGEIVGQTSPALFHDPAEVAARGGELTRRFGEPVAGFEVFVRMPKLRGNERRVWTYLCRDGQRRTVDLTVTVLRDPGSEIAGFLGTAVDITAIKQTEQMLRETVQARETAQALLEEAGRIARLGSWELPLGGAAPTWSDVTYAIHEVPVGTPISLEQAIAFFHPEDRGMIGDRVRHAGETGAEFEFEARLITALGREVWVHSRGGPVRDAQGQIVALRGVFQDVDERRRAAELLERRNQQLEAARALAEAHGRAKAEFLANMSHEIRTPLNAIIGMSDLLTDALLPPHERELVETIHASGDVLLALINNILDFSKIEAGQLDLERIPLDLRACVESALDLVAGAASRNRLDLLYWIDRDVPSAILGDVTRLRQVLVNLAGNAIKFTNQGEVFVKLSRKVAPNDGAILHVAVRDSGIGIPPERMDRLFHAFSQVDASTTRQYGGTGLGLAISHRLVTTMGGRIWVDTAIGEGSTFQFEIPLKAAEILPPMPGDDPGERPFAGRRLLIVDDNATSRWILQRQAEFWGMMPVAADGATSALAILHAGETFDAALLDVAMPEMDGYALAAEIRKLRSPHDFPILILTSFRDAGHDLNALGIAGVLTKPVKITPLFHALRKAFGNTPAEVEISSPRKDAEIARTFAKDFPLRILLAEDNLVNQRVASLLLARLGYEVAIVANGCEVLAAVGEQTFDVILLDIQMPEMDGFETARELCRRDPTAHRPWIIAQTAHAAEGDRNDCLAAGMDDYLSKPIRSETLKTTLQKAFARMRP